jgi:hypothetical protein
MDRNAFYNELHQLLKKYHIEPYFFFGSDSEGEFSDYEMTGNEVAGMVLTILHHENFAVAARKVNTVVARELVRFACRETKDGASCDLSAIDEMKWTMPPKKP